jgi:hypothetical protein
MITLKRIVIVFVAVLLLAHGLTTADSHPLVLPGSTAGLQEAISHDPVAIHAARGGHQCREAGCTIAACPGPCAVMPMILPDLPVANLPEGIPCFFIESEQRFVVAVFAPPVPPPRSLFFKTTGGFSA